MLHRGIDLHEAERPLFVGVDVGGTNIKLGIVDNQGRALIHDSIKTEEERGPADAVRRIWEALRAMLVNRLLTWDDIAALGLGTPGTQDVRRGWILEPPNLPHWRDFPIRDALAEACGKPCAYVNDANAAAYGEFWVGAGSQSQSMVMFTLGTGVGGGIILDGQLVNGENSFGSELGHLVIDCRPDARKCVWGGGRGQLEAYASASAVVARAEEALLTAGPTTVRDRLESGDAFTTKMLAEEAELGDKFSLEIILETARYLAAGITSAVHAVDPGLVVLGGAMTFGAHRTKVGELFLATVREEFQSRCFHVVANTRIDYASLGGDAGFIGAAGIGRAMYLRSKTQPPAAP